MVYLLAVNVDQISPIMAFRSMAVPFLASVVLFLLMALVTHNWRRAALVTAFWVVAIYLLFFFFYVPLYRTFEKTVVFGINIGRHRTLILGLAVLLLAGTALISTRRSNFAPLTVFLNLVAIAAIAIPLGQIVLYKFHSGAMGTASRSKNQAESAVSLTPGENTPDVYYIILDMYTREDLLKDFFKYDNSPFLQFLMDKGFYVANCSQSNYNSTQYSIGSSLNMDYLPDLGLGVEDPDLVPAVQQNRVMSLFKQMGYRTVNFESGFSITELRNADEYLSPFSNVWDSLFYGGVNSFEAMILKNSAGTLIYEAKPNLAKKYQTILDTPYIQYRERIAYALEKLETIPASKSPKFVFAHILAPHDPFVFDKDGNFVFRETPFTLNGDKEYPGETYIPSYTSELQYLNAQVEKIVTDILENSDEPPIIILQGDHGAPRTKGIDGSSAILNAYYLPMGKDQLYPTISPVNTFRVVFDQYFNGQFPLLQDQPYKIDFDAKNYISYDGYACSAQPLTSTP